MKPTYLNIMHPIVKSVFSTLVFGGLLLSSCATNKKISSEYDDLYYRPSDKNIKQNNLLQQAQTKIEPRIDTSNVVLGDSLVIKKTKSKELKRMVKNREINNSQMIEIRHNMRYTISTKDKILTNSEIDSTLKTNDEAYLKYLDFGKKIDKSWKAGNKLLLTYGLTTAIFAAGALTTDDPQKKNAYIEVGFAAFLVETGIGVIIGISLDSQIKKFGKEAINIYNNGIRNKTQLPKAKISFGMMGNGLGMKINF
jgi:hypothetical protein